MAALAALLALGGCLVLAPGPSAPPPRPAPASRAAARLAPPRMQLMRGVLHCHSRWSHDSPGRPERIVAAARRVGLDFVALTDHARHRPGLVLAAARGWRDGVLLLAGVELRAAGASALGIDVNLPLPPRGGRDRAEPFERLRATGALVLLGHAESFRAWKDWETIAPSVDGLEIANLHAMALAAPRWRVGLEALALPPRAFFRRLVARLPQRVLDRWDALGSRRPLPGWGGADPHENIRLLGARGGVVVPYEQAFRAVCNYVWVRERSAEALREGLAHGRGWVAFEFAASAADFRCAVLDETRGFCAGPGETIRWRAGLVLEARAPGADELRLLCDGTLRVRARTSVRLPLDRPGVWRVEAWREGVRWVIANPVYVRGSSGR
ncbi:MAG: hypothetical protein D6776_09620 [Planctomycetota bacterium]|nr:MAG: hypothetical protein D6776_09620 [Planctomycetota bacterium]